MRWLAQRTPTIDGDRLYAVQVGGHMVCLDVRDGSELWRTNYVGRFGAGRRMYGVCDFPLVDKDRVIIVPAGSRVSVAALDRKTGRSLWESPAPDDEARIGYAATVLTEGGGVRQYVTFYAGALRSVRASDGKPLWSHKRRSSRGGIHRRT